MRKVTPAPTEGGNAKVTKSQWLDLALETLVAQGVDGVRILPLARRLGVSRSSFYWYFASRKDLLDHLLDHWRATNTQAIVDRANRPAPSIIRAVLNLFECWADERLFNPQLDFTIRSWARQSKSVRKSVDGADEARLAAIRDMYLRHGYGGEDAFIRARVLYYMQIGYYALEVREPMAVRFSHLKAYLMSFTGKQAQSEDIKLFQAFLKRANKL
jgi:AcrR family transcriptional regulator